MRRSTTSSLAKRHASASESAGKAALVATGAKKRPALANVTNQRNVVNPGRASGPEPSKIVRVILRFCFFSFCVGFWSQVLMVVLGHVGITYYQVLCLILELLVD